MTDLNRRSFIKLGAGSLADIAVSQSVPSLTHAQLAAPKNSTIETLHSTVTFDNKLISQIDPQTNQIIQSSYWGIPAEYASSATTLQLPITMNLEALEKRAEINCTEACNAQIHSEFY